ncbi:hypothetical protein STEG23_036665, partial [Scotinomys teguina]
PYPPLLLTLCSGTRLLAFLRPNQHYMQSGFDLDVVDKSNCHLVHEYPMKCDQSALRSCLQAFLDLLRLGHLWRDRSPCEEALKSRWVQLTSVKLLLSSPCPAQKSMSLCPAISVNLPGLLIMLSTIPPEKASSQQTHTFVTTSAAIADAIADAVAAAAADSEPSFCSLPT